MTNFLKGICYDAFPYGYDPSTANDNCLFFASDIASYNLKPLWGQSFSPINGPDAGKMFTGRDDLGNLKKLGVNLIRLYNWEPRNNHIPFLDYCSQLDIQVLVPVSNNNLNSRTGSEMNASITGLINSFKLANDYHPAIYGILIGCELDKCSDVSIEHVICYTKKWMEIEYIAYNNFRKVKIGHPISFSYAGPKWIGYFPCIGYLNKLLPSLLSDTTRDLNKRLILCPHTYSDSYFLFDNAKKSGKGWINIIYEKYNVPILICEIGCNRLTEKDYKNVIMEQLESCIEYDDTNKLLGVCYFQYTDKVWMPDTSEGYFGLYYNTKEVTDIVRYGIRDFMNFLDFNCNNSSLNIQILKANPILDVLKEVYK